MTLEQIMAELLEFYSATDLVKYDETVRHNCWDDVEAWQFLRKYTVEDYLQLEINPSIDNYIMLYDYRNRNI